MAVTTCALPPQLVVLGSCQSAGGDQLSERSDRGFLSSIGVRLLAAGVPLKSYARYDIFAFL